MSEKQDPLKDIRNQTLSLEYAPIVQRNLEGSDFEIPMIDIYVNDACNLRCHFCVTAFGKNVLPVSAVPLISQLRPRVLTITGGGEPSIYRSGSHKIEDFVGAIREEMGAIPIGMMSNGVVSLDDYVQRELDWLRVSMNASDRDMYQAVHQRDRFDKVIDNLAAYINGPLKKLAVGFVFTEKTAHALIDFARMIFDRISPQSDPSKFAGLTLQFRPEALEDYSRFTIDDEMKEQLTAKIGTMEDGGFKDFLLQQTNILQVLDNQCFLLQATFKKCFISFLQMNIDADGQAYPCPQKAHVKADSYGNIFDPNFIQDVRSQVRSSFDFHNSKACANCSQTRVNSVFDGIDFSKVAFDQDIKPVFF